jgi:hypothetical protein
MIYRIKEKFWSWGNDFTIGDEAGSVQLKIHFFESADLETFAPPPTPTPGPPGNQGRKSDFLAISLPTC